MHNYAGLAYLRAQDFLKLPHNQDAKELRREFSPRENSPPNCTIVYTPKRRRQVLWDKTSGNSWGASPAQTGPADNGGVERANGQLAGYQEALADFHGRAGLPSCADAEEARQIANDLSHPAGWKGPTSAQLWEQRPTITSAERASFLATVTEQRTVARAALQLPADTPLGHYQAAAVDRRAVRDSLLAHRLLKIEPRRRPKRALSPAKKTNLIVPFASGAVILQATAGRDLPALGQSVGPEVPSVPLEVHSPERVHCSTDNSPASGQNYG